MKTPGTLRLFYALWPDDATAAALLRLQASLHGRKMPYANLHMTLVFLGQQQAGSVASLTDILAHMPRAEMLLTLDRLGYFARNRIAWVGPRDAPETLLSLQHGLVQSIRDAGIRFNDQHAYKPHVTLVRDASMPPDLAFDPIAWQARQVALVQSTTTAEGSVYRILATRSLDKDAVVKDEARIAGVDALALKPMSGG